MSFDDAVAGMIETIKGVMGIAVTYNGEPVTALNVIYGDGPAGVHADTAELEVAVADLALPAYRATVVIGANTWRVHRDERAGLVIKGDGASWRIPLIRDERAKRP